ncbi:MAG: hypothetical protein K2X93_14420 [Candidatus Obscuribacterales bacterium]|nr:hypothetical protein [Candidatus Obscuribacterales bacterium]
MTFCENRTNSGFDGGNKQQSSIPDLDIFSLTTDSTNSKILPERAPDSDQSIAALAGLSADLGERSTKYTNLDIVSRLSGSETSGELPSVWFCSVPLEPKPQDTAPLQSTRATAVNGDNKITHLEGGSKVEEWIIKRGADGRVSSVEPQIAPDGKPDRQYLHEARESLVRQVESSKLNEADKLRVYQAMQQLEQLARRGKLGPDVDWFRTDIAANYQHASRLLLTDSPVDQITSALKRPSAMSANFQSDASGNHDDDGLRVKGLKETDRENEIFGAHISGSKDTSVATFTLNGKEFEAWKIKLSDGKVDSVESLLHPEPPGKDPQDLKESRLALIKAVHNSDMPEKAKVEFYRDLAQIEFRARSGDMGKDLPKIRTELAETYKHLEKLLDKSVQGKVPLNDRVVLARQLAHQLADTKDIDQGTASDACRITAVECRLSVVRPSVVAKIVKEAALEGVVSFGNPAIKVTLDGESLKPASKFATAIPREQEERSFASQLFQVSCMNLLGKDSGMVKEHLYFMNDAAKKYKTAPVGDYKSLVFKQLSEGERRKDENQESDKKVLLKKDNGMRVIGITQDGKEEGLTVVGKTREGSHQMLMQAYASQYLIDIIDPGRHAGTTLAHKNALHYTQEDISNGKVKNCGVVVFDSTESLEQLIADAKAAGKLPLMIATRNKEPDPGEAAPHLEPNETNHIITIRDYFPPANGGKVGGRIVTDDQFGRNEDRRKIFADDLYKMTIDADD